jgi:hypothetical protein
MMTFREVSKLEAMIPYSERLETEQELICLSPAAVGLCVMCIDQL